MNNNAAVKDNIKLLNKIYEIDNIEEPMKLIDIILNEIIITGINLMIIV